MIYLDLYKRYMKYGAPIIETTMPAGISVEDIIIRPIVSDISKKMPPNNPDVGINILLFAPTSFLAKCGAISPIKSIDPPIATHPLASATAAIDITMNSLFIFTPKPIAIP